MKTDFKSFTILILIGITALFLFKSYPTQTGFAQEHKTDSLKTTDNPYKNAVIDIKTFKVDTLGWGYDIYVWKSLYVHQPSIPALPGNRGFSSDTLAKITAEFVAWKIKNNIIPPSVSLQELDSLGVLK